MSKETQRTVLAGFLIASLTLMIPFYLQFIGLNENSGDSDIKTEEVFSQPIDDMKVTSFNGDITKRIDNNAELG